MQQFECTFVKLQFDNSVEDKEYELYQKEQLLEDNANVKITNGQFCCPLVGYEAELANAKTEIAALTYEVRNTNTVVSKVKKLIAVTMWYTSIEELTPEILNSLVDKIVVHEAEKKDGKRRT